MACKIGAAMLPLLVAVLSVAHAQYHQKTTTGCITPDGRSGDCRNLRQCQELVSRLSASSRTKADYDYVRKSNCGYQGMDPKVCCASNGNPNVPTPHPNVTTTPVQPNTNNELLPKDCGLQESNRIVGGNATDLYEYPWMALLEYDTPNGLMLGCGGSLINSRYVLTAAHCLKGRDLPATYRLNRVRLGEHKIHSDPDCLPDGLRNRVCNEPAVIVPIEERIAHENYDPLGEQRYDIALLRLVRDVPYTKFIRPICLARSSRLESNFVVAGWGRTESRGQSDVKLQVSVPLVDNQRCAEAYRKLNTIIGDGQMCAGGQKGKDSCTGDSGGPLMQQNDDDAGRRRWHAVGVVSFGPWNCGTVGVPGVYTRLFDFMPWLTGKLTRR